MIGDVMIPVKFHVTGIIILLLYMKTFNLTLHSVKP